MSSNWTNGKKRSPKKAEAAARPDGGRFETPDGILGPGTGSVERRLFVLDLPIWPPPRTQPVLRDVSQPKKPKRKKGEQNHFSRIPVPLGCCSPTLNVLLANLFCLAFLFFFSISWGHVVVMC